MTAVVASGTNQFKLKKNGAILSKGAWEKLGGDQQQRKSMSTLFSASENPKDNFRLQEKRETT